MVMVNTPGGSDSDAPKVDAKTHELMAEFEGHFREVIALHPDAASRRDHVFQAWAMQKIAGLQVVVEAIARQFNKHVGTPET